MKVFAITTNYNKPYTRLFAKRKNAIRAMFDTVNRDFDVIFTVCVVVDGKRKEVIFDDLCKTYEEKIDYLRLCEEDELNEVFGGLITIRSYYIED